MKYALIAGLILWQGWTSIQLVQARHEIRVLTEDVSEHDGTIEQITDDITNINRGK